MVIEEKKKFIKLVGEYFNKQGFNEVNDLYIDLFSEYCNDEISSDAAFELFKDIYLAGYHGV